MTDTAEWRGVENTQAVLPERLNRNGAREGWGRV